MRGIVAAGLYEPAGGSAAPDEDGFTLAIGALDRLAPSRDPTTVARVRSVGDLPSEALEDVGRFLGLLPTDSARRSESPSIDSALGDALGRADGGPDLVLAVALPSRSSGREASLASGPDAAVALWIDERAPEPEALDPGEPGPGLTIDRLVAEARRLLSTASGTRSGGAPPPRGYPELQLTPDQPVAQGAYVPWARYVEGIPAHWRLAADRCAACGTRTFPPRSRCSSCGRSDALEKVTLDHLPATVVASTTIGPGGQPTEFDEQVARHGPYHVVIVEFEGGVRATLQVVATAATRPEIGARVSTQLRRLYPMEGRWRYGRKALVAA